jgi:hypothetical protein
MPIPEDEENEARKEKAATGFALMLETGCEDFEIMRRLISGELAVVPKGPKLDFRASPRITMALAKSFIFHVVRARRICEHSAGLLAVDRTERKLFMVTTAEALGLRNVNEHGFELNTESPPSQHLHQTESASVDETAMVVLGPDKILMGPLNLVDLYGPTDRMRKHAGFSALAKARPPAA